MAKLGVTENADIVTFTMPKGDYEAFKKLIWETCDEYMSGAQIAEFEKLVKTYFPKGA